MTSAKNEAEENQPLRPAGAFNSLNGKISSSRWR